MPPIRPLAKRRRFRPTTICWRWRRGNWPSSNRSNWPGPGSEPNNWPNSNRKLPTRKQNGSGCAADWDNPAPPTQTVVDAFQN